MEFFFLDRFAGRRHPVTEYAAPLDPRENVFAFNEFLGLRNNVGQSSFAAGDLATALNVDIDDARNLLRRKGYSAVVTAALDRDLWATGGVCLGVGSNALKLVNPDLSLVTLRPGLTSGRALSYAPVGNRIFYANGVENGCVQNGVHRTWGVAPPAMPVATSTGGVLRAGLYQYAVTYLRADGQESGTGRAGTITLAATGGISLSAIPVSADATVTHKVIYATSVGGETLYRRGLILNTDTTFVIRELQADASPLITQFLSPPPAGDFLALHHGWMLVAKGAYLYPSEVFGPELFDLRKSIPFLDRITMVAPVRDGVWIGTDSQVIWVAGDSPETWTYNERADYGVIPGTLAFGDSELLGSGEVGGETVACFASKRGLCVGRVGGALMNLTERRFAYPVMDRGAAIVRRHRGIAQLLVTTQGTEQAGNVAA